ncbi:MAG TPA: hypothetical protein VK968_01750, partial [Roseimicrobium sp.]|nr:hypothetical protein [Roseimicrobium sp.]
KLEYSTRRRTFRRRWIIWLLFIGSVSTAGWWFGPGWWRAGKERFEVRQYQKQFDAVRSELTASGTWLAAEGDTARDDRALLLFRSLASTLPRVARIAFVQSDGPTNNLLIVGVLTSNKQLGTFTIDRNARNNPYFHAGPPIGTVRALESIRLRSCTQSATNGKRRAFLTVNGYPNEVYWTSAITTYRDPQTAIAMSVNTQIIMPISGWMEPGGGWWPDAGSALHEAEQAPELITIGQGVHDVAFMPDGRLAAIWRRAAELFDPATPELGRRLARNGDADKQSWLNVDGHPIPLGGKLLGDVRVDPWTGAAVPTAIETRNVVIDVRTLEMLSTLPTPAKTADPLTADAIAVHGDLVAFDLPSLSRVRICNWRTAEKVAEFEKGAPSLTLSFSPDGKTLVIVNLHAIRAVDVKTQRLLFAIPKPNWLPYATPVRWSEDGRVAVVAAAEYAYVWTMTPPYLAVRIRTARGDGAIAISPDGKCLAVSGPTTETIRYWPTLPEPLLPQKP